MTTLLVSHAVTRRSLVTGGVAMAGALGLAGCGSSDSSAPAAKGPADFPARVQHKYGTTVVPAAPTRVVSAGSCTQDSIIALGTVPVGITEWYGDQPDATWPWAHARLGGAHPTVLSAADGFGFEKIAKLAPDLIVATNDGMTAEDYATLSAIAPTLPQSGEFRNYYEPWTVQTHAIGAALGQTARAERLVTGIRKQFREQRAQHPEFEGSKAIFLQNAVYDGSVIAYQQGFSTQFLTDLGFVIPGSLDAFAKDAQAYIPLEQLSVLNDADVLIWATEKPADEAALQKVPGFTDLDAVRSRRSLYTGGMLSGAIYFSSPLSLPYVLDKLVPQLSQLLA